MALPVLYLFRTPKGLAELRARYLAGIDDGFKKNSGIQPGGVPVGT